MGVPAAECFSHHGAVRRVKLATSHFLVNQALRLLSKASDERLVWLTHLLERGVARDEHHKVQLRQLRQLFEQKHPAIELTRRLFTDLHPNYRRALISNLGINATWQGDALRREFYEREGIYPPYLLVISPTMRCNLRCLGCYAGEYPRTDDPLSFDDLDRIVSEAKEMGSYLIVISGGEPFVRSDLLDLYQKHRDAIFLVYTNGTRIDEEAVARMQESGNVAPALSLEGFEAETDARRGPGVYARVMETMDRLREAGVFFGFSATATSRNMEVYLRDEFYNHMIQKGCYFGWFFIFVPVGQDSSVELMVTAEQRDRLRKKAYGVRCTKPIFVADFWNDGCLTGGCMSGGSLYMHVNYRGDLEPCVFIHFAKDNIKDIHGRGGHLWDVLKSDFFCAVREFNRKDPNRLRPCMIIDHNEWLEEVVRRSGACPTHLGAEDVIGRLAPEVREWAARYWPLAEAAWNSGQYDWAKTPDWANEATQESAEAAKQPPVH